MQELRFVLIIVGALAIAALLFHGLWTSRKDGKAKFGNKPLGKLKTEEEEISHSSATRAFLSDDADEVQEKKVRKEPAFSFDTPDAHGEGSIESAADPLIDGYEENEGIDEVPSFTVDDMTVDNQIMSGNDGAMKVEADPDPQSEVEPEKAEPAGSQADDDFEVIVLNVHCAGKEPFVGTRLFDSLKQNGLLYGEMDIFHRHADLSGIGKVLFSVANMMQPGTLKHDNPDEFTTKGISFFMTLPCFGDPDQNFKMMLRTAQQIADDIGGNVLDEKRNLMTPDRLAQYRQQIQAFKARNA